MAHKVNDASDIVEGPFKLTDVSIELVASATIEYSKRLYSRMLFKSIQDALEVAWEIEARHVSSQACFQIGLNEGESALGLPARL